MLNVVRRGKQLRAKALIAFGDFVGLNLVRVKDYYSPLPVNSQIRRTMPRWFRASGLSGISYDIDAMKRTFTDLHRSFSEDFRMNAGGYERNTAAGFGPGFPALDAQTLYYMLRRLKPKRYLEIGSGLSSYYASLAAARNKEEGQPLAITCIEPFPHRALMSIDGITVIEKMAQDVPVSEFEKLEAGDVLFIDSSHALKIDSDVAYLMLEVLPRVARGVVVHIHDVPFPYNVPFPPERWIFGEDWPVYWNEAMVVQAFLAFNTAFEVMLSTPMIRYADKSFLPSLMGADLPPTPDSNPYSSLWLKRVS